MGNIAPAERVLAAASGSTGGLGKIGTVAAAATLYVRCDNTGFGATNHIGWRVQCNKAHAVTLYRCRTIPTATITLTDATAVDNDDNFVLNGITFTAKTSGAVAASNQYNLGADNGAASVNLTALLNSANGVPGITFTVAAGSGVDVITCQPTTATVMQFAQGTSAANEIAWSEASLASLVKDNDGSYTGMALNSTTAGTFYEQWVDGWPHAYLAITNNDAADAATVVVGATRY